MDTANTPDIYCGAYFTLETKHRIVKKKSFNVERKITDVRLTSTQMSHLLVFIGADCFLLNLIGTP